MRPAQCWSLGCQSAVVLRQVERPHLLAQDFRVEERFGFEGHLFSGRLCRDGKKPSVFLLGSDREPSRFAAATSGKKAPEGPTPKPIPTRCEPGRFAVRNIEHRTSNIQHPISKGGAKPPKATSRPPQGHLKAIYCILRSTSHPKATPRPPQGYPKATPRPPQGYPKATPKPPQSHANCQRLTTATGNRASATSSTPSRSDLPSGGASGIDSRFGQELAEDVWRRSRCRGRGVRNWAM